MAVSGQGNSSQQSGRGLRPLSAVGKEGFVSSKCMPLPEVLMADSR